MRESAGTFTRDAIFGAANRASPDVAAHRGVELGLEPGDDSMIRQQCSTEQTSRAMAAMNI